MIRLRRSVWSAGTMLCEASSAFLASANRHTAGLNFGCGDGHIDGSGRAQPGDRFRSRRCV